MKVCPGVKLAPYPYAPLSSWASMLWGSLYPRAGSKSSTHSCGSLAADPTPALQILGASVIHGGCSPARTLAHLPTFWVQHPPGTLACSLILHSDEPGMQGQIVANGVLPAGGAVTVPFIFEVRHETHHPVIDLREREPLVGCALDGARDQVRV